MFSNGTNHPINIGKNVINIALSTEGIIVTSIDAIESHILHIAVVYTVPKVHPAVAWQIEKKAWYHFSCSPLINPINSVTPYR